MKLLPQKNSLEFAAPLPKDLLEIEQHFDNAYITDIPGAVKEALQTSAVLATLKPGATVALGVGSRGIANLVPLVRAVVDQLRLAGAQPFIFPAMGSHGGGTAEGQKALLAELGITEAQIGVEIRASMSTIQVGQLPNGPMIFQDSNAAAADHTFLMGRIKPHTDFRGTLESGLTKMAVVGMGKHDGAIAIHVLGAVGFQKFLAPAARLIEQRTNLIGGLAIIENACHETAELVGFTASEIGTAKEVSLQEKSKRLMPSFPLPEIDILVVQQLGKNISGSGMDTNVLGRLMTPRQSEPGDAADIAIIAVLDITHESKGNAVGIGLADVTTQRLLAKIDWTSLYTNAVTAGILGIQRAKLPIVMADDRRALQVAVRTCGKRPEDARFVFIQDTLSLERLWVSRNLEAEIKAHPRLQLRGARPLTFDEQGAMSSPWLLSEL